MRRWTSLRVGLALLVAPVVSGCATMRELPREQFAARPERRHLVVEAGGQRHRFARATFGPDSMVGYPRRPRGTDGTAGGVRLGLDDVSRIEGRQVDWYRTSLLGGLAVGALLAALLSRSNDGSPSEVPPPCTKCP